MKKTELLLLVMVMLASYTLTAQVAITPDNSSADGSAMLEVKSTTKGFLLPRMTGAQIEAIQNPADGLQVYNTDDGKLYIYVLGATQWKAIEYGTGTIAVLTIPGAPTIGTAVAGDTEATVPFTAPVSNGGSAITSYTATSTPGGFTGTLTQAGSGTITVTGLVNGTAYTFTVTATNAIGTGAASAASNSVTPAVQTGSVTNPTTGKTWMDRNLGASQVATSSTDADSYGDLYQWGRSADGHQIRTSATTTTTNATNSAPTTGTAWYGKFILESSSPNDWLATPDATLWQGESGTNNPCPTGYRLPTDAELDAERTSWVSNNNAAGAYASPLKLPVAGSRNGSSGSLSGVGSGGYYWSSTVSGTDSRSLYFVSSSAYMVFSYRANGRSVRCIKD